MIYFTSDTHLGHENLVSVERKEFSSIEEHDNALMENINRLVGKNDTLVHLGDFAWKVPGRYRPQIKCRNIFLILGNHDKETKIRSVFGGNVWTTKIVTTQTKEKVYCSHYPHAFWPSSHYGSYHAYGHIHCNDDYEYMMNQGLSGRRSMDVGVDMAFRLFGEYRPISEREFLSHLYSRAGHDQIPYHKRWDGFEERKQKFQEKTL